MAVQEQEASAQIDLINTASQQVMIEAMGHDVLLIEGNAKNVSDPDEIMPDWCGLVMKAVNLGMLSGAASPWTSNGAIVKKTFDPELRRESWRLSLINADPGVFLVLLNLLRARDLEAFSLRTIEPRDGQPLPVSTLKYPRRLTAAPFPVEVEPSLRSSRNRSIQLVFAQPPDAVLRKATEEAIDVWSNILILAGYTVPDKHPRCSYTLTDVLYWFDSTTFTQSFDEAFDADDAAFNAIVNWAAGLHHAGHAVERMILH